MGAVYLGEDVPGIDEENTVIGFALLEKPEGGGKGDGVEHIGGKRQHPIDQVRLDQPSSDFSLGVLRIGGGVCHHQRGTAALFQGGSEERDPEIVGVRYSLPIL